MGGILLSHGMYGEMAHAQPFLDRSSSHSLRIPFLALGGEEWQSLRVGRTSTHGWLYNRV
jgi:hypothetical protein